MHGPCQNNVQTQFDMLMSLHVNNLFHKQQCYQINCKTIYKTMLPNVSELFSLAITVVHMYGVL